MEIKQQLFSELANVANAMGSAQRLELLDYLAQAERDVDTLSDLMHLSQKEVLNHLMVLQCASLVSIREKGADKLYSIASDEVIHLIHQLRTVTELQSKQMNQLIESYIIKDEQMAPMSHEELLEWMDAGNTLILDIRPKEEFFQGHIVHALNVPPEIMLEKLGTLTQSVAPDTLVVTYCRGPYCLFAHEAVRILQEKGVNARRLQGGFPEWKAAGLPVNFGGKVK